MKNLQLLLLFAIATVIAASPFKSSKPLFHLNSECAKGVTFWCENVLNAKKCNAIDFCIKSVWETHLSASDSDLICDDCKEWVGKARSFIEKEDKSGEVIKSLKFTCDLIPIESLQVTCEKDVDENVPEILKMLESAMESDMICSKLLFCDNENYEKSSKAANAKLLPFTCSQCHHISGIIDQKLSDVDEVLENMLGLCGELSSFSDSCSSIVMMNFDDIYSAMRKTTESDSLCEKSKACKSHQKAGIVNISTPTSDPKIPCELCEQMMLHLRELLIANTTDIEFKNVMMGFCHQMGKFSDECVNITDEYYEVVYKFLSEQLNANKACSAIGICPKKESLLMPSMPLITSELHPIPEQDSGMIEVHQVFKELSLTLENDGAWCSTCQFVIHFMQEALAKPTIDNEIEDVMENACKSLPKKINGDCVAFVELYGDALMSLWAGKIDARLICPKMKICPPNLSLKVLQETATEEKPTCPFCLMALQEIHDVIESNNTKQSIEGALSKLCSHLSDKLVSQCNEFVKEYTQQVVEMLLADFTPQEACIYIKLCTDNPTNYRNVGIVEIEDDFGDLTELETISNPQCELCKEIVKIVEQRVINKKSKDEIRRELEKSCGRLKKFSEKCKSFVDKHSDQIVDLIEKQLGPKEVCRELIFCVTADDADLQDYDSGLDIFSLAMKQPEAEIEENPQCVICEFVMTKLEDELNNKSVDQEIEKALKNVCATMPTNVGKSCKQFVDYYFNMVVALLEMQKPSEVCAMMRICSSEESDLAMIQDIQNEVYTCAICKGIVEGINDIVENPSSDTNLENFEEKLCEKFAENYQRKCIGIAKIYGILMMNVLKTETESDKVCYKLKLCSQIDEVSSSGRVVLID